MEELTFRRTRTPVKTGETRPCLGADGKWQDWPHHQAHLLPHPTEERGERKFTGLLVITGLPPTLVTKVRGLCETYSWGGGNRTHGTLLSWGISEWTLPSTPCQGQERTPSGEEAAGWLPAHPEEAPPLLGEATLACPGVESLVQRAAA